MRTAPDPSHVWQVLGCVPGFAPEPWQTSQVSQLGTRISVSKPLAACSRLISSVYFRSAPRYTCGPPRRPPPPPPNISPKIRSEEHTSELQSLMRISYAVFCLKKKKTRSNNKTPHIEQKKQHTT